MALWKAASCASAMLARENLWRACLPAVTLELHMHAMRSRACAGLPLHWVTILRVGHSLAFDESSQILVSEPTLETQLGSTQDAQPWALSHRMNVPG